MEPLGTYGPETERSDLERRNLPLDRVETKWRPFRKKSIY